LKYCLLAITEYEKEGHFRFREQGPSEPSWSIPVAPEIHFDSFYYLYSKPFKKELKENRAKLIAYVQKLHPKIPIVEYLYDPYPITGLK